MDHSDIARYLSVRFPVTGMLVYRGNVALVTRRGGAMASIVRGDRRPIKELSRRARARLAFVALATPVEFSSLMTITYPAAAPLDGKAVKHNLTQFLKRFTRDYGAEYLWVLEFQKRGAPHFHIATDIAAITAIDRVWLALNWIECLGYGKSPFNSSGLDLDEMAEVEKIFAVHSYERAWEDIRAVDGARHYMVKEAVKTKQKLVPSAYQDVGRFWGCSRAVTDGIAPISEIHCDEQTVRDMLESFGNRAYNLEIVPKVIFCVR